MKTCKTCGLAKPESEFYRQRAGYLFTECKTCHTVRTQRNRQAAPERWKLYGRRSAFRRLYGIEYEAYQEACAAQDGVCSVCSEPNPGGRALSVDHCHQRDVIRGILCDRCNRGIGLFRDRPDLLRAAADYLDAIEEVMPILLKSKEAS